MTADTPRQPALDRWLAEYRRHTEAEAAWRLEAEEHEAEAELLAALVAADRQGWLIDLGPNPGDDPR